MALAACTSNPGGEGTTEDTEGSSTGMSAGPATTPTATTAVDTTAGDGDGGSSSAVVDSSTGPACTPGEEGCTCDERDACGAGLACIDDTCTATLCGNGDLDAGEDCDDGNRVDSDGCDNDCTVSAGAIEVVAGDEHVCARFHTGDIKCWGNHDLGRLGYLELGEDIGDNETPATRPFVNVGAPVEQLALGSNFTCALLAGDDAVCWGVGQHGRLGQGSQASLGSDQEPADIPPIQLGGTPVQIAAGGEHACAVLQSGALRCWGRNNFGQLGLPGVDMVGDDELPGDMPPVNLGEGVVALQVAVGAAHTCALLGGGDVLCFGRDHVGQLGTPTTDETIGDNEDPADSTVVALAGQAVLIAASYNHTCVAYVTGEIQCWGDGGSGRLGYGTTDNVGDIADVVLTPPLDLDAGTPSRLDMGEAHTCVQVGTQIYCWGEGDNGRLGYGNTMDLYAPAMTQVNLALPLAPSMVTAGRRFTCGRTEGSQVKCWGHNNRGQLGYGAAWSTDLGDNEAIDSIGAVMIE